MTSGTFQTFPVASIFVDRPNRQRRELKDIESLAKSIADVGLIHPPVIRRSGELIVGERRFTAIKSLGWTDMPVQFIEDLDERELKKVELEENTRRVDITWQEQTAAIAEYHRMKVEEEPTWTMRQTAEALGRSDQTISDSLAVKKEIESGNKLVIEAPKLSTAINVTRRKLERKRDAVAASIPTIGTEEAPPPPKPEAPLMNRDFLEWSATYGGPKFNLIHCDFPYGVGMHKSDQGAGKEFGTYADDEDVYWKLLDGLARAMSNVVHESAHLIFWFSMDFYEETRKALEAMGWTISPFPLIWMKSDNTGIIPDANRGPRRIYETAFFGTRGDRKIVSAVSNATLAPGREKSLHMNEKPISMLKHFMRMLVDETSMVLDPTCGSANALKAAKELGASEVLGLEKDETFFTIAKENFYVQS